MLHMCTIPRAQTMPVTSSGQVVVLASGDMATIVHCVLSLLSIDFSIIQCGGEMEWRWWKRGDGSS